MGDIPTAQVLHFRPRGMQGHVGREMHSLAAAGPQGEVVFGALLGGDVAVVEASNERTVLPPMCVVPIILVTIC